MSRPSRLSWYQAHSLLILEVLDTKFHVCSSFESIRTPEYANEDIPAVEIYFARFFGLTLVPILAQVILSIQSGNEDVRKSIVLTTLFLHLTSALHVFNRFRLTRDSGLTRDAGGSLLLTLFGTYLWFSGRV